MTPSVFHLEPFQADMLRPAGDLLALRQQFLRATRPELPARFEDPVQAALAVTEAWQRPHAAGVAAFDHDRLVGYLIGDMVFDQIWGRAGWVRLAGCALAPGQAPELIGDLYQMLGAQWVAYGCFHHVALMPAATPDLIGAWFDLSFGIQQVHALASLVSLTLPTVTRPPTLEIRQAGPADRAAVAGMYRVIRDHLATAPVWGIALPEDEEDVRSGYGELVDDAAATVWLALEDGQALSMAAYERLDPAEVNLLAPERCTELVVAATVAAARGRGVGSALTHHAGDFALWPTAWRAKLTRASPGPTPHGQPGELNELSPCKPPLFIRFSSSPAILQIACVLCP